jgi:hypothetical protein
LKQARATEDAIAGAGPRLRRHGLLAAAVGSVLLLATACGGSGSGSGSGKAGSQVSASPAGSAAQVSISPKDGSNTVDTSGALKVAVADGKLTAVNVTSSDGSTVAGSLAAGGTSWQPSGTLRTGTHYTVAATAVDSTGRSVTERSSFTTMTPANTDIGYFNVDPSATYGVGMEVSINFTSPVTNQAAVKQAITVTANPSVDVEGHWFGNQRLDFRPQNYWAPGTQVTLHLHLDGVQTSPGVYGKQYKDVSFTIGRSQVSVADDNTKTMKIYRNGTLFRTLPISLGDPQHTTWNGKMVIIEKDPTVDMNSQTVGLGNAYNIKDVPHAMRLTTSGTFVHGNYWRPASVFGHEDTSHGCVGLQDVQGGAVGDTSTPAGWFYNNSLIGDVVQVQNSPDKVVQPDNGLNGWNMDWNSWVNS